MKTKFLSLVLACALILSALPLAGSSRVYAHSMSALTITGTQLKGWAFGSAQTVTLRFFADQDFDTSTGEIIKAGNSRSGAGFYRSFTCTFASATILTIPTITDIPTTTDSPTMPTATWTARFFQGNTPRDYWITGFFLKHTVSSPQVWSAIYAYNNPPGFQPHPTAITYDQAALLISQSLGTLNFANVASAGRIETSVSPVDVNHPIAVENSDPRVAAASTTNRGTVTTTTSSSQVVSTNDTRVPTQAENDALVGSSGAPSSTNKYVTDADTRVPTQAENDALVGTSGSPGSSNKYATDVDPRLNEDYNASSFASLAVAVAAMPSGGATLTVTTSMAAAGVTLPSYVDLRLTGKSQLTGSGTVTIVGDFNAPKNKRVFASGLTVSFSGNKFVSIIYPEWWGLSTSATAAVNAAALNAANGAVAVNGSGTIQLGPGVYNFNDSLILGATTGGGDGLGSFTGISVKGTNGLVGTELNWTGSTSGIAVKIVRGRSNVISDLFLNSGVAHGSSIGLQLTGPSLSTQVSGVRLDNVTIREFHIGFQVGGPSTTSASEVLAINCTFSQNDIGYFSTGNGNTVNVRFINCSAGSNLTWGYWIGDGSGATHLEGGGIQANGINGDLNTGDIRLSLGWNGTVHIQDVRFEPGGDAQISGITNANPAVITTTAAHGLSTSDQVGIAGAVGTLGTALNGVLLTATVLSPTTFSVPVNTSASSVYGGSGAAVGASNRGGGGIYNLGGMGIVSLENCAYAAGNGPAYPLLRGLGNWSVEHSNFGADGQDGWIVYNADNAGSGSLNLRNNEVQNTSTAVVPAGPTNIVALGIQFDPTNTGSQGMKITGSDNYYTNIGAVTKHDDVDAIIGRTPSATGKVYATRRVNAYGQITSDWFDWGDQDATPSVRYASAFKVADTGATVQTQMDDGVDGQTITIFFTNGNRTIQDNANQQLTGNLDFVGTANDLLVMRKVGSVWCEISRSVN